MVKRKQAESGRSPDANKAAVGSVNDPCGCFYRTAFSTESVVGLIADKCQYPSALARIKELEDEARVLRYELQKIGDQCRSTEMAVAVALNYSAALGGQP